jgi:ElaB/YqjD/DUF883 family membrane-anchored ribosome-binding protein
MGMLNTAAVQAHQAVDQVVDAAVPASKWLEEQSKTLTLRGEKLADSATKYIAAHPVQSLALALAAGYLISRLTR